MNALIAMIQLALNLWDRWKPHASHEIYRAYCDRRRSELSDSGANAIAVASHEVEQAVRAVREGLFRWDPYGQNLLMLPLE